MKISFFAVALMALASATHHHNAMPAQDQLDSMQLAEVDALPYRYTEAGRRERARDTGKPDHSNCTEVKMGGGCTKCERGYGLTH